MNALIKKLLGLFFPAIVGSEFEDDRCSIVPAQPGTEFLGFSETNMSQDADVRLILGELQEPVPVIAWRIFSDGNAVPVTAFGTFLDDGHPCAIKHADGRVQFGYRGKRFGLLSRIFTNEIQFHAHLEHLAQAARRRYVPQERARRLKERAVRATA